MKNFLNKCWNVLKTNFLFYAVVFLSSFLLIKFLLNVINIEFLGWIYNTIIIFTFIMVIIGIFQLLFKIKHKDLKYKLAVLAFIMSIPLICIFVFTFAFTVPENIVEKNNEKVVLRAHGLGHESRYYYKYYNIFFRSKNEIERERLDIDY